MTPRLASFRHPVRLAAACLGTLLVVVASLRVTAAAAPVTAAVEAGWRAERLGNPALLGPTAGTRLVSPRFSFAAADDRARLDATLIGRFESPRLPASGQFAPLSRTSHAATLDGGFAWSPEGNLAVSAEHRQFRDRLVAEGPLAAAPGTSEAWSLAGGLHTARIETSGQAQGWSQAQASAPGGGKATRWNAAALPLRAGRDAMALEWRERRFFLGSVPAVWTRAALAGVRHDASPEISIRAGIGTGVVSDGRRDRRGAAAVVELGTPSGRPGLVAGRVEFQEHFPTLASIELRHRVGAGWLSAGAESAMEVAGSPEVDRALVRRLSIAVQETLWRATVLGAEAGDVRSRALTQQRPPARANRASLSLTRRVRPWLQVGGRTSFLREWDEAPFASPPTRRLRLDTFMAVVL